MVYIVTYLYDIIEVFDTRIKALNYIKTIAPYDRGSYHIFEMEVK